MLFNLCSDKALRRHDHAYGRVMIGPSQNGTVTEATAERDGAIWVVSMAGIKMCEAGDHPWMERKDSRTQTYQLVQFSTDQKLSYEAFTISGVLYDAFKLNKETDGSNEHINKIPAPPE